MLQQLASRLYHPAATAAASSSSGCSVPCVTGSATIAASGSLLSRSLMSSSVTQRACFTSQAQNEDDSLESPRNQRPNRFTTVYNQMQQQCPDQIRAYATCVMDIHNGNHDTEMLEKGSCQAEFSAVKECFRSIRLQQREERQN
jgi:hypothetical protein